MLRWAVPVMCGLLAVGCDEGGHGGGTPVGTGSATPTPRAGSGGGFSADLARQIGGSGDGSATAGGAGSDLAPGDGGTSAGSGGSAAMAAGSGAGVGSSGAGVGSSGAGVGSSGAGVGSSGAGVGSGGALAVKPVPGIGSSAGSGAALPVNPGGGSGSAGSVVAAGSASKVASAGSNQPRVATKPSAEVSAIKLSLSPNWDRDVGEPGTISLVVKIPEQTATKVFSFRYGYEDAKAPADRDAYKKWLADNKLFIASLDRQRGAAWYLEGVDDHGAPAFRIVVTFGGRKLICGGSLYKDAASNQLGDIRDKTIIQAKEICETVAL